MYKSIAFDCANWTYLVIGSMMCWIGENCKNWTWNNALRKFAIPNIDIAKMELQTWATWLYCHSFGVLSIIFLFFCMFFECEMSLLSLYMDYNSDRSYSNRVLFSFAALVSPDLAPHCRGAARHLPPSHRPPPSCRLDAAQPPASSPPPDAALLAIR